MSERLILGMRGLGDTIYMRGFISQMGPIYLDTAWPELFEDLPVKFIRCVTTLRTQAKNVARQAPERWVSAPRNVRGIRISYGQELSRSSIPAIMRRQFGVAPKWSLPPLPPCPVVTDKPIAVVRPVTVRTEWRNEARNPLPEYIATAARRLRECGYYVVSVADLQPGAEWALAPLPEADQQFHAGELDVLSLLSLVAHARACVAGVGWMLPACIAAGTPLLMVAGGHGGHNAPERLTDASMDLTRIAWAMPNSYCRCIDMKHHCTKRIPNFDQILEGWLNGR